MIDFTDAPKLKKGYGGANGNKISILLNGSRWMLKFPSISERSPELHYTKGCISEYIGSHIFQSTGISAQDTLLGTYFINGSEKTVVACRDFVEPGFELQDFASLKNQMVDSARSGYGTELKDMGNRHVCTVFRSSGAEREAQFPVRRIAIQDCLQGLSEDRYLSELRDAVPSKWNRILERCLLASVPNGSTP